MVTVLATVGPGKRRMDRRSERGVSGWESFELLPPGLRREALQWLGVAKSVPNAQQGHPLGV
jgi:hypothetical protein